MAAVQLLPIAEGLADSADFTLAAGESATLAIKDATAPILDASSRAAVQLKDDGGAYWTVYTLTGIDGACVLAAPGTYRVRRINGTIGVFRG